MCNTEAMACSACVKILIKSEGVLMVAGFRDAVGTPKMRM